MGFCASHTVMEIANQYICGMKIRCLLRHCRSLHFDYDLYIVSIMHKVTQEYGYQCVTHMYFMYDGIQHEWMSCNCMWLVRLHLFALYIPLCGR